MSEQERLLSASSAILLKAEHEVRLKLTPFHSNFDKNDLSIFEIRQALEYHFSKNNIDFNLDSINYDETTQTVIIQTDKESRNRLPGKFEIFVPGKFTLTKTYIDLSPGTPRESRKSVTERPPVMPRPARNSDNNRFGSRVRELSASFLKEDTLPPIPPMRKLSANKVCIYFNFDHIEAKISLFRHHLHMIMKQLVKKGSIFF